MMGSLLSAVWYEAEQKRADRLPRDKAARELKNRENSFSATMGNHISLTG
jgi:hypothetical protein